MKKIIFLVLTVFLVIFSVGCANTPTSSGKQKMYKNSYISIDINPSIEIITDENGLVVSVMGLNDKSKILLIDLNFEGKTVEETTQIILQLLNDHGYIKDNVENEILFTTESDNKVELDTVLLDTVEEFKKESQNDIKYINGDVEVTEELKLEAERLNISLGKLKLILTIIKYDSLQTKEVLKELPIKDLNKMLLEIRKDRMELISEDLEKQYDNLKQKLENEAEKFEILALINLVVNSSDEVLKDFLNENINFEQLKTLFLELKSEIENIEITDNPLDSEEITDLKNQINLLKSELETFKEEFKNLNRTAENYISEKKRIRSAIEDINNQIDDLEDIIEDLEEQDDDEDDKDEDDKDDDDEDDDDKNNTNKNRKNKNRNSYENKLENIFEKFEDKLKKLGLDFEEIEDLFEDEIEKEMDILEKANKDLLKNFKDECKKNNKEMEELYRQEKDFLKSISSSEN